MIDAQIDANALAVLNAINAGAFTKAEIKKATGLSVASVLIAIASLNADGFISGEAAQ